jgi:hypothetical protein
MSKTNVVTHHRTRSLVFVLVALSCALLAGSTLHSSLRGGASRPSPVQPKVTVSLVAPMTGATVGVSRIDVSGTVSPAGATVDVGGVAAAVHAGSFTRPLTLSQATTTIPVIAAATGYAGDRIDVTVHYSPGLAGELAAARKAVWTAPKVPVGDTLTASIPINSAGFVPQVKLGSQSAAPGNGAASPPTTPSPPVATPPSTPPPLTVAQIEHLYVTGCNRANGGRSAAAYCTCAYGYLARAGLLASRHAIEVLARELAKFNKTHNAKALPRKVLRTLVTAQIQCVSDLPKGPLGLSKLPSLNHPAVPAPGPAAVPAPGPAAIPAPGPA